MTATQTASQILTSKTNAPPAQSAEDLRRNFPPLDDFVRDTELFLRQVRTPQVNHLQFVLDDIPVQVSKTVTDRGIHLCFWATLGYLPYSAESPEKRHLLVDILSSVHYLSVAQIGVDPEMKIVVRGDFIVPSIELPNFIFLPLLVFWQEARPFMKLIGENL